MMICSDPEMVTAVRVPRVGSNFGRVRVAVKSVRFGPTAVQAAEVVSAWDAGDQAPMPTASTTVEATASGRGRSLVRMVAPCGSPDPRAADPERRHHAGTRGPPPMTNVPCSFRSYRALFINLGLRMRSNDQRCAGALLVGRLRRQVVMERW